YKVRIEKPALEMGIYNLSVSNIGETEENATIPEEVNVTAINATLPENATETEEAEEVNATIPEEVNATIPEEVNATESSLEQPVEQPVAESPITEPENAEQPAEQTIAPIEEITQEETISEPEITEETEQPTESEEQTGITGSIIKNLFKITARIIGIDINETQGIEDLKYKNTLTVYIERDFASINGENSTELDNIQYTDIDNSGNISVGDIIELDPTLKTIEIIKAEHLNENRSFISYIYNSVKEKDENWSETIYNNEYVRVTFIQNLTKDKDITVYARAKNTTECYDNETEILTRIEVDCDEVDINDESIIIEYYDESDEIDALNSQTADALSLDEPDTYINNEDSIINNKDYDEKNNGVNLTPTVKNYSLDNNNYEAINYINFSVDNDIAEEAELILTVRNRSEKSGLFPRQPGSTPGLGASALSEKCYREEWKLFKDLNDNEKVMTLNAETGEKEWQLPVERQIFDNEDDDMYKIELEDGSELVVSPEHKVYAGVEDERENQISLSKNILSKSFVVNTLTNDCLIRCLSLDQIAEFVDNANAKKSISSGSGINSCAFSRKSSYSTDLKNLIDSSTSVCLISNSCSESSD
ncbi:MAG: hypothetical protein AABY27_06805, partial [Pseudomonadota bacterium]